MILNHYYGAHYAKRAAPDLDLKPATIREWLYSELPVRSIYFKKLLAINPRIMKQKKDWVARKIETYTIWLERQEAKNRDVIAKLEFAITQAERIEGKKK